jgi:signal transduction histidine kinase
MASQSRSSTGPRNDGRKAARAGEPFFTAKPTGSGLGLGLFPAHAFAEQMGGSLHLRSERGTGTSVVLELRIDEPTWDSACPGSYQPSSP